jgi:hypothetical protein
VIASLLILTKISNITILFLQIIIIFAGINVMNMNVEYQTSLGTCDICKVKEVKKKPYFIVIDRDADHVMKAFKDCKLVFSSIEKAKEYAKYFTDEKNGYSITKLALILKENSIKSKDLYNEISTLYDPPVMAFQISLIVSGKNPNAHMSTYVKILGGLNSLTGKCYTMADIVEDNVDKFNNITSLK